MHMTILLVSLAVMALVAGAFIAAVRASRATKEPPPGVERRRGGLIWSLLILGIVVTAASLWRWPHDVRADSGAVTVNVTGAQWSWEIDQGAIPAGATVIFNVHTKDVNHGMGVYDPHGRLLAQTQGMPGYVNQVRYVFEQPGTYRVLCLEFCGIGHHDMTNAFEVVANEG